MSEDTDHDSEIFLSEADVVTGRSQKLPRMIICFDGVKISSPNSIPAVFFKGVMRPEREEAEKRREVFLELAATTSPAKAAILMSCANVDLATLPTKKEGVWMTAELADQLGLKGLLDSFRTASEKDCLEAQEQLAKKLEETEEVKGEEEEDEQDSMKLSSEQMSEATLPEPDKNTPRVLRQLHIRLRGQSNELLHLISPGQRITRSKAKALKQETKKKKSPRKRDNAGARGPQRKRARCGENVDKEEDKVSVTSSPSDVSVLEPRTSEKLQSSATKNEKTPKKKRRLQEGPLDGNLLGDPSDYETEKQRKLERIQEWVERVQEHTRKRQEDEEEQRHRGEERMEEEISEDERRMQEEVEKILEADREAEREAVEEKKKKKREEIFIALGREKVRLNVAENKLESERKKQQIGTTLPRASPVTTAKKPSASFFSKPLPNLKNARSIRARISVKVHNKETRMPLLEVGSSTFPGTAKRPGTSGGLPSQELNTLLDAAAGVQEPAASEGLKASIPASEKVQAPLGASEGIHATCESEESHLPHPLLASEQSRVEEEDQVTPAGQAAVEVLTPPQSSLPPAPVTTNLATPPALLPGKQLAASDIFITPPVVELSEDVLIPRDAFQTSNKVPLKSNVAANRSGLLFRKLLPKARHPRHSIDTPLSPSMIQPSERGVHVNIMVPSLENSDPSNAEPMPSVEFLYQVTPSLPESRTPCRPLPVRRGLRDPRIRRPAIPIPAPLPDQPNIPSSTRVVAANTSRSTAAALEQPSRRSRWDNPPPSDAFTRGRTRTLNRIPIPEPGIRPALVAAAFINWPASGRSLSDILSTNTNASFSHSSPSDEANVEANENCTSSSHSGHHVPYEPASPTYPHVRYEPVSPTYDVPYEAASPTPAASSRLVPALAGPRVQESNNGISRPAQNHAPPSNDEVSVAVVDNVMPLAAAANLDFPIQPRQRVLPIAGSFQDIHDAALNGDVEFLMRSFNLARQHFTFDEPVPSTSDYLLPSLAAANWPDAFRERVLHCIRLLFQFDTDILRNMRGIPIGMHHSRLPGWEGGLALHIAIRTKKTSLVHLLLDYDSGIHILDDKQRIPFSFAVKNRDFPLASSLLLAGTFPSVLGDIAKNFRGEKTWESEDVLFFLDSLLPVIKRPFDNARLAVNRGVEEVAPLSGIFSSRGPPNDVCFTIREEGGLPWPPCYAGHEYFLYCAVVKRNMREPLDSNAAPYTMSCTGDWPYSRRPEIVLGDMGRRTQLNLYNSHDPLRSLVFVLPREIQRYNHFQLHFSTDPLSPQVNHILAQVWLVRTAPGVPGAPRFFFR